MEAPEHEKRNITTYVEGQARDGKSSALRRSQASVCSGRGTTYGTCTLNKSAGG